MAEKNTTSEQESPKELWLSGLASFIVEANQHTWAADGAEIEPQRPGFQELEYRSGDWCLRDSYSGYFRAPGWTTVYYKDVPCWCMVYLGEGMNPKVPPELAKPTFAFLKKALMQVTPELPYRGPKYYKDDRYEYEYRFRLTRGDIQDGGWYEKIVRYGSHGVERVFSQHGMHGIMIHKGSDNQPIYPWEQ